MPRLDRSLIAGLAPFQGLTHAELDQILQRARSCLYKKDLAIFEQDAEAHTFFLLLDGHVRVVRTTPDGQQVVARYISKGELFGIAVAMGRTTYPATAIAAVDCVVAAWPNSHWPQLSARFPSFAASAYQTIGTRLQETLTHVERLVSAQVEQRVAHTLLKLAEQAGRITDEGRVIDFPITRQDIAEMTGTTLHTVSRLLSSWESNGLVKGGRKTVTVTDPQRLAMVARMQKAKN